MKATKPPVRNRPDTQEDSFYWAFTGDSLRNPETVAGNSTTYSAPSITVNKIGTLIAAEGPHNSLQFY